MNRIQQLVEDEDLSSLIPAALAVPQAAEPDHELATAHCIFTPLHYEHNYAYPLIVWMHGPDDDERQVTRAMPLISMRNYIGVGPRGTIGGTTHVGERQGYSWSQDADHIARAEQNTFSAIGAARRWLNVAPSRIYIAGYGCGGTMALRIALANPQTFAGVLSLGGEFPSTLRPLARIHAARRLKIFLATGRDSELYPQRRVCENLRLFHSAGLSVCLRQYPCGDDLTTHMLADLDRWIMEQLTAPEPVPADQPSPRSGGK